MADYKTEEAIWSRIQQKSNIYLKKKNAPRKSSTSDEVNITCHHTPFGKYRPNMVPSHRPICHALTDVNSLHNESSKYKNQHSHQRHLTWPYGYKVLATPQPNRGLKFPFDYIIDWQINANIIDEVITEMMTQLVTDIFRQQYWRDDKRWKNGQNGEGIFQEIHNDAHEIIYEDILHEDIIEPVISGMLNEAVQNIFQSYVKKLQQKELNELFNVANLKLVDSLILEQFLYSEAQPRKVWTNCETTEEILDAIILDVVLHNQFHMFTTCSLTQECRILQNVYQNAVTDIGLDVLMEQLVASLSEDLKDLDDYETGFLS